jgi:uncharacterized protein YbgA (DUF1722 family)/uncharacterized protein YbbK (DUF523 family)
MIEPIKLGVSACLLGQDVRYNGGHSLDRYITGTLSAYASFVPVCPEVECGLGTPRETMRLVGDPTSPRLVTTKTNTDYTERMRAYARRRVEELEAENLCGFIFKSGSPSSGMERVKVYGESGMPAKVGVGLFARAFMDRFPLLPVEEEGRLHDPKLRETFIESIFVLKRWRDFLADGPTAGGLVDFHTRHKLLLRSRSLPHYRTLGKLVSNVKGVPFDELCARYQTIFLEALKRRSTVSKHSDVLLHILGYFKRVLSADEKKELLEVFDNYRRGYTPLVVPITLVNHYVRKYDEPYLKRQWYLNPHPVELQLRNHV